MNILVDLNPRYYSPSQLSMKLISTKKEKEICLNYPETLSALVYVCMRVSTLQTQYKYKG